MTLIVLYDVIVVPHARTSQPAPSDNLFLLRVSVLKCPALSTFHSTCAVQFFLNNGATSNSINFWSIPLRPVLGYANYIHNGAKEVLGHWSYPPVTAHSITEDLHGLQPEFNEVAWNCRSLRNKAVSTLNIWTPPSFLIYQVEEASSWHLSAQLLSTANLGPR